MIKRLLLSAVIAMFYIPAMASPIEKARVKVNVKFKDESYIEINNVPASVNMAIDPFQGSSNSVTIKTHAKWSVSKKLRFTGEIFCYAGDEDLCQLIDVTIQYPKSPYFALLIVRDPNKPVVAELTENHYIKNVDDHQWEWHFNCKKSHYKIIEARNYKVGFRITVESAV